MTKRMDITRQFKTIDGEIIPVKYKAFRLPVDLTRRLDIYSATEGVSLEDMARDAFTAYLKRHGGWNDN